MATGFPIIFGGRRQAWTPAQLSTALWLDANDTSTITLNGSTVSQWADKSGNGRNVSQATAASQPAYQTTGLNSKATLNFDSTDDFLASGSFTVGTTSSVFVVLQPNALGSLNRDYITAGSGGNGNAHILFSGTINPTGVSLFSGNLLTSPSGVLTAGTPSIIGAITNGASSSAQVNGTNVLSGNAGSQSWTNGILLGRSLFSVQVDAKYSEVVVIQGGVSLATRQQMEGYLAWKWGLQANLPADHPYKTLPPTV